MQSELTAATLRFVPPNLDKDLLSRFLADRWGVTGEFKPLAGERDQNFRVRSEDGKQFVFKVASTIEDSELVDFQVQALLHLARTDPGVPVPRILRSHTGKAVEFLSTDEGKHAVRLLSWIDGVPMGEVMPSSLETINQVGELQGRVCKAFSGFEHVAGTYFMPWNILNGLVVSDQLCDEYLPDDLAARCIPALRRLKQESLPAMQRLPKQVIHNDAHSGNVMCDPARPGTITGVIDFGDLIEAPLVVDLATSMASIFDHSDAPLEAASALVSGFERRTLLPDEQKRLLYDATLARSILTVQLLEFRLQNTEVNAEIRESDLLQVKQGLVRILEVNPENFTRAVQSEKAI